MLQGSEVHKQLEAALTVALELDVAREEQQSELAIQISADEKNFCSIDSEKDC